MRTKNLVMLFLISMMALSCEKKSSENRITKTEISDSAKIFKDTLKNDKSQTINQTKYTPFGGTFGKIPQNMHDRLKDDYDKIFNGSNLKTNTFEINSLSFNKLIQKYKNSKNFLDIYFILDRAGQRNLMFRFTNEAIGKNYVLKNGDHQYIIINKDLQSADSEKLFDLREKFETRYENEVKLSPHQPFTLLVRDTLANINDVYGSLKIYPCLDNEKVSLTSEFNDAVGEMVYGNRGALYP